MNDEARVALGHVVKRYGPAICNTPRSCELFIRQACGPFPDESRVLIAALRQGVTDDLFGYQPTQKPWDEFTNGLRTRLQSGAGLAESEGDWAVDTWARVLGRHPENWKEIPMPVRPPSKIEDTENKPKENRAVKTAMAIIVAIGGGLGGAMGAALVPGTLLITSAYAKLPIFNTSVRSGAPTSVWLLVALALFILGSIGFVGGAAGAALGWLHGRGDQGHWTAFTTACGGAFASSALGSYFCGIFGSFFGAALGAFGAATHSARRGGYA
jgi:hypothetical protein